jgi:hypothetical protein
MFENFRYRQHHRGSQNGLADRLAARTCAQARSGTTTASSATQLLVPEEGLGHALRTPLTALHGALGLLDAGLAGHLPPDARAMIALALRNCSALESVVEAHLGELGPGARQPGNRKRAA